MIENDVRHAALVVVRKHMLTFSPDESFTFTGISEWVDDLYSNETEETRCQIWNKALEYLECYLTLRSIR